MTIDLESLRKALNVVDEAVREAERAMPTPFKRRGESTRHPDQHIAYMSELREAWRTVDAALAELTARRARDAEVEALVAAAKDARCWVLEYMDQNDCPDDDPDLDVSACVMRLDAALLPFAGDKT